METLSKASQVDKSIIQQLLKTAKLPYDDLTGDHLEHFFVIKQRDKVLGCVGLEIYKDTGLLRSLAVLKENHGQGFGQRLVHQIGNYAQEQGIKKMYLLTTTAEEFFETQGYVSINREEVPESIRQSQEFASLCPASAKVMRKMVG